MDRDAIMVDAGRWTWLKETAPVPTGQITSQFSSLSTAKRLKLTQRSLIFVALIQYSVRSGIQATKLLVPSYQPDSFIAELFGSGVCHVRVIRWFT